MTVNMDADNALLRSLREISVRQNVPAAVADYLESYFADADLESFGDASPEELHGAALQHHRLGLQRPFGKAAVTFYTPDFDRHGWHSPHAVIDIVTDDMPFLVDSITMTVYRQGLSIHKLMHPVLGVSRDAAGVVVRCAERDSAGTLPESWIHLEVDRISDARQIDALCGKIAEHLADVRAAVEDHLPMREKVVTAIADLQIWPRDENGEIAEFLRWIAAENFVFLGYTHYRCVGADGALQNSGEGGLGLLRRADDPRFASCLADIPGDLAQVERRPSALTLVKADAHSSVHRPTYLDFVGLVYRNAAGAIVGEHVFVGLYATHVYHVSSNDIPVVRSKVAQVRSACAFAPGGYRDKALIDVLETYPREELIEIGAGDLERIASGIVMLQEHPRVRVFLRHDPWGRYVSALVYMPRDRFDTTVRRRITTLLAETLHADSVDFFLLVGESRLARLHLIARLPAGARHDYAYDAPSFEREVARIVRGWHDELQHHLIEHYGEERGNALLRRYGMALPLAYQDQVPPTFAVSDLDRLDAAERSGCVEVKLNTPAVDDGSHQHIKLFLKASPRPLSAVLPVFDNMGVTVLSEQPFTLSDPAMHIADFAVRLPQGDALDDAATRAAFVCLLESVLRDEAENDGFNRLALLAGIDAAHIAVLRAYARYLRQAGLPFSQVYIERCLAAQPRIARLLADLFVARLAPSSATGAAGDEGAEARAEAIGGELTAALARVSNLDDDRILSGFRTVIEATLRSNAWQQGADGKAKGYLSFKIASRLVPFLPKPVPLYEISGPSFAQEVAQGLPTAVTLASGDADFARRLAVQLHRPHLRIYANDDLPGVEVGGAVKNVMAIATGICDGLGLGHNARAALMTRGLAEVARLGVALGGQPATFMGLAGMGDLILTCTGDLSRNRRVGIGLAAGKTLPQILDELGHVAEGVSTAREVARLAAQLGIEMPITEAVDGVLHRQVAAAEAVETLLSRDPKPEMQ